MNEIINADWREAARRLPDGCVHCIVTSPPYWGQRDYGVAGQLGLEKTFHQHIDQLVEGFRELKRILRDDGIMWLNYGDKYARDNKWGGKSGGKNKAACLGGCNRQKQNSGLDGGNLIGLAWRLALALQADGWILRSDVIWAKGVSFNAKYSGSTMPEPVNGTRWERCRVKSRVTEPKRKQPNSWDTRQQTHDKVSGGDYYKEGEQTAVEWSDCPGCAKCHPNGGYVLRKGSWRPTRAHEYLFQFVKGIPYYADMEAVREDNASTDTIARYERGRSDNHKYADGGPGNQTIAKDLEHMQGKAGRNIRDVWTINPQAYPDAHYATFPEKLVEPCIKVSTSKKGVCPECGCQWARVIDSRRTFQSGSGKSGNMPEGKNGPNMQGGGETGDVRRGPCVETKTIGWRPSCGCCCEKTVPAVVYDPFAGSGTVAAVAARLGRNYSGSEVKGDYVKQANAKIEQAETGIPVDEARKGQMPLWGVK